jgi:subtilase family serine protease
MQTAYALNPVLQEGIDGAGQTIIIIDSFGSPTIEDDLATFDSLYDLPDPPSFVVISPLGTVPFDPTNPVLVGWALETTIDVEWAHVMAPGASIVVLTSNVDETEGVQGLPEFLELEEYALAGHLGKIISQSWAATENTLFDQPGRRVIENFEYFYYRAGLQDVTVVSASGDSGSANIDVQNNVYPFPTVVFPASSPLVTAVGGTSLTVDNNSNYESEVVWNHNGGASGGGVSQYFAEPLYQYFLPGSVQRILKGHRGLPDVAIDADPATPAIVYATCCGHTYYAYGGTSLSTPMWAGIVADANQLARHPLGLINPKLYVLQGRGFHDITSGNNQVKPLIPGYNASKGWDPTTGWGSPDLSKVIPELAR